MKYLLILGLFFKAVLGQDRIENDSASSASAMIKEESPLQIHAYFNQAVAVSSNNTYLGISDEGTTEYRSLAIQLRYDFDFEDAMVLQFSHKELGKYPYVEDEDILEVDWVFYQRRIGRSTVLKAGRVQLPFGIYSEIKDVGTLLPFYRIPATNYPEGSYASETVDGVTVNHVFDFDNWQLQADAFYGGWDYLEAYTDPVSGEVIAEEAEIDKAYGGRLMMELPIEGVKVGASYYHGHMHGGLWNDGGNVKNYGFLLDATRDRFFVRGEYNLPSYDLSDIRIRNWFFHGGYKIFPDLSVNAQIEESKLNNIQVPFQNIKISPTVTRDYAVGFNYSVNDNIVLKLEGHYAKTLEITDRPMDFYFGKPVKLVYGIGSVSVTF